MLKVGQEMFFEVERVMKRSEPEDILDWPVSLGASLGQSPMMEAGIFTQNPRLSKIQRIKMKKIDAKDEI